MTTVRASYWLVTINNPTPEDRQTLREPADFCKQLWYQDEVGENGTLHIQLCINSTQVRFSQVKEWLPRAHIEAARNSQACKNYCKKSDTSVSNMFVYWKAGTGNVITEPVLDSMLESLLILFNAIPFDWNTEDPETLYKASLLNVLETHPEYVNRLTNNRVHQNYDLCFTTFLRLAQEAAEMSNQIDDPLDSQTDFTKYAILPDCFNCDKDECELCYC